MFDVQYNRNTFNPHVRKNWVHAHRADTLELTREYLRTTRTKFKNEFGYPSDVEYRIVEVEPAIESAHGNPDEHEDEDETGEDIAQFYGPSARI